MVLHNRTDPEQSVPGPELFIRVSSSVHAGILQIAELERRDPSELVRLMIEDALAARRRPEPARARTARTPQRTKRAGWQSRTDLYLAIVETLHEMGGSGHVDEILPRVKRKILHLLSPYYQQSDPGGVERWIHATHSARRKLVEKGIVRSASPRGLWELHPTAARHLSVGMQSCANRTPYDYLEHRPRLEFATRRMSPRLQNGVLNVEFADGDSSSWILPDPADKTGIRAVREQASAFARSHGASPGQIRHILKVLTEAGYHLMK